LGYEVILLVADGKGDDYVKGVKIHGLKKPKNKLERIIKTTREISKKAIEINADVYHFHDPELIFVGLKLLKKGKKVVYDVHEDLPRQRFVKKYGKIFRPFLEKLLEEIEAYAVRKFSAVLTATPHIMARFSGMNNNLYTLCNFPIIAEFSNSPVNWEKKEIKIAYIGDIILERGIIEMVKAIENIEVTLDICGKFSDKGLRQSVELLPGWRKVKFHGYVDRFKVAEVLGEAYAGMVTLHPHSNFIDSYPVKMFEYMASSVPVISSDFPLFKEIVEGNNCGFCVNPMNTDEIAKTISFILNNPTTAQDMGENGKRAVLEKYNWNNEINKLSCVYQKLCS
tara:strand:- start:188 stop:1204 length:1017 start_codon:yes stop_codon:yes gene_type:complete